MSTNTPDAPEMPPATCWGYSKVLQEKMQVLYSPGELAARDQQWQAKLDALRHDLECACARIAAERKDAERWAAMLSLPWTLMGTTGEIELRFHFVDRALNPVDAEPESIADCVRAEMAAGR